MKHSLFILCLLTLICQQSFAHALWIETNPSGAKGKAQDVKVFFGEFSDNDITAADKWFSDLKDFSLVVITPSGKQLKLTAEIKPDHYLSTFTPDEDGVYTLAMHHTVKDVYHNMKLDYNSSATVAVGNNPKGNDALANNNVASVFAKSPQSIKTKNQLPLQAIYQGKPITKHEIEVFAANGWGKKVYSTENGEAIVTPLWPGKYMVEFSVTDETPGEHNGKPFQKTWTAATYILYAK